MADIQFRCRACGQELEVDAAGAGCEIPCPSCGATLTVPTPEAEQGEIASLAATAPPPSSTTTRGDGRVEAGEGDCQYEAFISYRHVEPDRTWAKWLHTALETYRVPKRLMRDHGLPSRLKRVFRDEEELPASADLSLEIEKALQQSRFLIVVCSPRTPESEWVNKEAVRFREMGRGDRILALLIEGEPSESFPRALRQIRHVIAEGSGLTREEIEEVEPLAADVRPIRKESLRQMRRMAKLRMLSCILGCRFDDLRQRERERLVQRMVAGAVGGLVLLVVMGALIFSTVRARQNAMEQARQAAAAQTLAAERARQAAAAQTLATERGGQAAAAQTLAAEHASKAASAEKQVDEWAKRYSEAYGEKADKQRLEAVSAALANPPPAFDSPAIEWGPVGEADAETITKHRRATLAGLQELSLKEALELASKRPEGSPSPSEPPKTLGSLLPEKFVLKGILLGVREHGGRTYVCVGSATADSSAPLGRESQAPSSPLACVIFDGARVADAMADFFVGQTVRVAISRKPRFSPPRDAQPTDGPLAIRQELKVVLAQGESAPLQGALPGMPRTKRRVVYWCLQGDGIERENELQTWIDPGCGAARKVTNRDVLARSPGLVFRAPSQWAGARHLLGARFDSATPSEGSVILNVSIPTPAEGAVHARLNIGTEARLQEFLDFVPGEWIEADVTLTDPVAGHADASLDGDALPWQIWSGLEGGCAWVHMKERPATLVLARGPRRKEASAAEGGKISPEVALVRPDLAIGKEVAWSGVLLDVKKIGEHTHLTVGLVASALGVRGFEAVTSEKDFIEKIDDFTSYVTNPEQADRVEVKGVVRPVDQYAARALEGVPILELHSIQSVSKPECLATVGVPRVMDAIGRKVKWHGKLCSILEKNGETHLRIENLQKNIGQGSYVGGYFEAVTREAGFSAQLADYVTAKEDHANAESVLVTGRIVTPKELSFRLGGVDNPVIELDEIKPVGDDSARAVVGKKRDPSTLRQVRLCSELAQIIRAPPREGTEVAFSAEFANYHGENRGVRVSQRRQKSSGNTSVLVTFKNFEKAWFGDYVQSDKVRVVARVCGEIMEGSNDDRKPMLEGISIVRCANANSLVTASGRKVPPIDYRALWTNWCGLRKGFEAKTDPALIAGCFQSATSVGNMIIVKLSGLVFSPNLGQDFHAYPSFGTKAFIEELREGDEMLAEVRSYGQDKWAILWMSRIDGKRVIFGKPTVLPVTKEKKR